MNISRNFKRKIARTLDALGYEIRRKATEHVDGVLSHYESCLYLLMGMSETINIVQVGANDGSINDPLYAFVSKYPDRSRIILVEPQEDLISHLEENYRFHSAKYIFNGAIGPDPELTLNRIRKGSWQDFDVPYAKGWPEYRAPTGVTSANYEHVAAWVSNFYKGNLDVKDIVETVRVESVTMEELLKRSTLFTNVDVLQIDAEGFDDQVIYSSNIEELRPSIINFELANLNEQRANALKNFLGSLGYTVSPHGIDGLAIRTLHNEHDIKS